MAKKKYEEANIQAIAETIREKTGGDSTYDTSEMASGVNEVFEAGKQKEWSDFWDGFQTNGRREIYAYAFSRSWNNAMFRPKYDIRPTNAEKMFAYSTGISDLKGILESCNVVLDTSKAAYMANAFQNSTGLTYLPEISFESATYSSARIEQVFAGCNSLKSIDKVIYHTDKYVATTNTFSNCNSLTHLRIGGVIGNSFNVSWCPLDVESIKDVILHLKDYSGISEYTYTVTFKTSAFEALEAEGATAEYNGTPCTWAELIDNKKWNLVKA